MALLYAALGDKEGTFVWLERGYENRDAYMVFLKREPLYDAVRDDPRFTRLVKRVGLEP